MIDTVMTLKRRLDHFIRSLKLTLQATCPDTYRLISDEEQVVQALCAFGQQTDLSRFASAGPNRRAPTATHASASSEAAASVRNEGNDAATCVALGTDIPGRVESMCT